MIGQKTTKIDKAELEGILKEYEGCFLHRKDKEFIFNLTIGTGICYEKEKKILDKITVHAEYNKEDGEVRYQLNERFLTPEELRDEVQSVLTSKTSEQITSKHMDFLRSVLNSSLTYNLSARQIVALEDVLEKATEKKEEVEKGVINLFERPKRIDPRYKAANGIINYILERGANLKGVSLEDIFNVQEMVINGEVDLRTLEPGITRELEKTKTRKRYIPYLSLTLRSLDDYLRNIDPNKHDLENPYKAIPKGDI